MVKILVIEDDPIIRDEVLEWLGFEDFEAYGAENGREGVQKALDVLPDLIVSDISMPEMNGYDVLRALRQYEHLEKIPFIFLTAHADKTFVRQGMEMGADDYVTKPFTIEELLAAIHARLSRHANIARSMQKDIDDLKLKLVRLVNHELKTPVSSLNFVQQIIERQIDQLTRDELVDLLQTLRVGTDRIQHLVQQTVYFTQIETGILSEEAIREQGKSISLWQIIPSAIDEARRFAYRNHQGTITVDQRDPDIRFMGEPSLFKHALAELLSNALNSCGENQEVRVSQWHADGSLWISIADEGQGMSKMDAAKARNLMEQVGRDSREQQGLGLGLSIAHSIIQLHGGTLALNSVVDKGTQITLNVPLS